MRIGLIRTCSILLIAFSFCDSAALAESNGVTSLRESEQVKKLMVIGASYAGDWKITSIGGYQVINHGVGGDETEDMLARLDQALAKTRPDAVLIWGFINDITRTDATELDKKLETVKANLLKIVENVSSFGARPILATEVTLSLYRTWDQRIVHYIYRLLGKVTYPVHVNRYVLATNEWLRRYASDEQIAILDIERILGDEHRARLANYTQEDGSHLTESAYQALTVQANRQLPPFLATQDSSVQ